MGQATPGYGFFIPRRFVKARLRTPGRCQAGPSSEQLALEHHQFSEDPESRPLRRPSRADPSSDIRGSPNPNSHPVRADRAPGFHAAKIVPETARLPRRRRATGLPGNGLEGCAPRLPPGAAHPVGHTVGVPVACRCWSHGRWRPRQGAGDTGRPENRGCARFGRPVRLAATRTGVLPMEILSVSPSVGLQKSQARSVNARAAGPTIIEPGTGRCCGCGRAGNSRGRTQKVSNRRDRPSVVPPGAFSEAM